MLEKDSEVGCVIRLGLLVGVFLVVFVRRNSATRLLLYFHLFVS